MKRFFTVTKIRPDKREEYFRLHREIDPEVVAAGHEAGLRNYTMFPAGDLLYSYYEYVGADYEGDMRRKNEKPAVVRWQAAMRALLDPAVHMEYAEEWHNDF